MRHAVVVFAATATLVFHMGGHIGNDKVIYEVGRAVGHTGFGGLRAIRPVVSAVAADLDWSLLLYCCTCDSSTGETAVVSIVWK